MQVKILTKIVLLSVVVVLVAVVGVVVLDRVGLSVLGSRTESRNTQIIKSVTRQQQVVLLSLGIQGVEEKKDTGTVGPFDIPFSERVAFLQFGFDAKLGIDGEAVVIKRSAENRYLVTIPEFQFLGHDHETFRTVVEDEDTFAWTTPEIDTAKAITEILNDEAQSEYVDDNVGILREQAKVFYEGIIHGIDPAIEVEFEFQDA